jgi:Na+/proline symporter
MSAQLNTVSGTIYEDFIVKFLSVNVSELTASFIMKCIVVVSGVICVALVVVVEKLNGIIQVKHFYKTYSYHRTQFSKNVIS